MPALIYRASYPSDILVVVFPFGSVNFIFLWSVVRTSNKLVVFDGCAKLLSPTFEDKSLLAKEKVR